ncbi:hypothetical protein BDZ89DRAFT_921984, partial [Hymenopellis radicata]
LALHDVYKFSTCSQQARAVVDDYLRRHNPFDIMIRPFLPSDLGGPFRAMLSNNHAVVSGSCALAYFMMEPFPDADLDVYARFGSVHRIGSWFINHGYSFVPRGYQLFSWPAFAAYTSTQDYPGEDSVYMSPSILDVFDFINADGKVAQIIAVTHGVVDAVLAFHSTVVMNIVSGTHGISFYPKANFVRHVNIGSYMTTSREIAARQKYIKRGWPL